LGRAAPDMDAATERANELVWLSDELLWRYGLDIDTDYRLARCLVLSEFFVATCSAQPDLTIYRIVQIDDERNISQLFAAARHGDSGTTDLWLYRDGPWEKTFRKLATEIVDLAPSQLLL
jgi:hypothetical protein